MWKRPQQLSNQAMVVVLLFRLWMITKRRYSTSCTNHKVHILYHDFICWSIYFYLYIAFSDQYIIYAQYETIMPFISNCSYSIITDSNLHRYLTRRREHHPEQPEIQLTAGTILRNYKKSHEVIIILIYLTALIKSQYLNVSFSINTSFFKFPLHTDKLCIDCRRRESKTTCRSGWNHRSQIWKGT